jgi:hypothetical protein
MIVHDYPQRSEAWHRARLATPTCSQADRILTPAKLQPAAGAETYLVELLQEYLTGYPFDVGSSQYMDRGTEMEPEARDWYALVHGGELKPVGFITNDNGTFGGSPDSLVGDLGLLELKVPAMHTHLRYWRKPERLAADYRGQVQAQLWVSEREWCDVCSFNPDLPPVVIRVTRDETYIHHFAAALSSFVDALEDAKKELAPYRRTAPTIAAVEAAEAANAA